MKVTLIGSPGSGKTTLAVRLYAELLERGISKTRYVPEYAQEYIGGNFIPSITTLQGQKKVTEVQIQRELFTEQCGFDLLICDSPIWIAGEYLTHRNINCGLSEEDKQNQNFYKDYKEYLDKVEKHFDKYDVNIFVPLFSNNNLQNQHRLQDNIQSKQLEEIFKNKLSRCKDVYKAPKALNDRESFIKYVASEIIEKYQEIK